MRMLTRQFVVIGAVVAVVTAVAGAGVAATPGAGPALTRGPASAGGATAGGGVATPPFRVKVIGQLPDGRPRYSAASPTGLPPTAIASVYNLSGLITKTQPSATAGAGQTIALVDAYHDPNALSDLNTWNTAYRYPQLSTCTTGQSTACFEQLDPQGTPKVNSGWVLEESLDIEWAHAEAPGAKIMLVEAASNSLTNLMDAVSSAVTDGATEVSMSFGGSESSSETGYDSQLTSTTGVLFTASAGDNGHGAEYPAASPNVIAVGGTDLNGCSGTSCSFTSESAWSSSGGGASAYETIPGYQSGYGGAVYGASTITALTGGYRGIPDVSFDADPSTGVSVYDSTAYRGQTGWFTLGGTSVGAPNWAGILAAGASAGATTLQGDPAIYSGGYLTNLRDIITGTNGNCGVDCTAGTGYDLVTGLGSPINYP